MTPPDESRSPAVPGDDATVMRDIMVPMRDGAHLATDIYLPAGEGPWPVILERTPYDKAGASRSEISLVQSEPLDRPEIAAHFLADGFAVVWQDCRGRHGSQGTFTKYVNEGEDGADTSAWLRAQNWCDGRIATMGLSYGAHTQMALACHGPEGLVTMILDSGGFSNAFTCGIRQGGAFELKQATWAYNRAAERPRTVTDTATRRAVAAEPLDHWFSQMPWSEGRSPVRWDPDYEAYLLDQWRADRFDEGWKKIGLWAAGHYDAIPDMPVLLMSSWYDAYVHTTLENYAGLKTRMSVAPRLIMGPWTHGDRTQRVFGDVDFGEAAPFDNNVAPDWLTARRGWMRSVVKEGKVPEGPQVQIFVMGGGSGHRTKAGHLDHGGHWVASADWPLPEAVPLQFHLTSDMRLADAPQPQRAQMSFHFDPDDPVPTIGGALTSGEPIFSGGAFDQVEDAAFFGCSHPGLPLSARRDVLSFETPPLDRDLTIAGPVSVRLWVSTDGPDTDFTAKLVDVHPPSPDYPRGYAMILSDSIFRLRYRDGYDAPRPYDPQQGPVEIEITPFATANCFKAGHRLRLDISSSNFPKFDVNPNTGEAPGSARVRRKAVNTVFLGGPHASRLVLQHLP